MYGFKSKACRFQDKCVFRDKTDDLNLYNPYSRIVCFVVYLYSMEFGDPPLFAELNRISRERDYSQLKNLGPIAKVLSAINFGAEHGKDKDD